MKFKKKHLLYLVGEFSPEENKEMVLIEDEECGSSRWSINHRLVFSYRGKYYISYYRTGATECQDESPYEYEPEEIECYEAVEYTRIDYKEKDSIGNIL